jgi:carbon monoxide dehydrogenase subunit G
MMSVADNFATGARMKLDGTIDIAAPAAEVWAVIVDPTDLAACVPGVREVVQVDATTFTGIVRASIGPMSGDFTFQSLLTLTTVPSDLVVDVEGTDSVTKSRVVTHVEVTLTEPSPGRTTLAYRATVTVKGRLAIVGEMVLRATAGMMIGQVSRCLRSRLEPLES